MKLLGILRLPAREEIREAEREKDKQQKRAKEAHDSLVEAFGEIAAVIRESRRAQRHD